MTYYQQIGAAMKKMETARAAGTTWVVARPGCFGLYEAPSKAAAEAMITKSMRRDGFQAIPKHMMAAA